MLVDFEEDPWKRFQKFPESEKQIVEALKGVEAIQQDIRYQYQLELLELNKKYAGLLDPQYNRRKALIAGDATPEPAELDAGEKGLRKVFGKKFKPPSRHAPSDKGIENFWLAVFMNHPGLSFVVAQRDREALKHLTDIRCTYFTERSADAALKSPVSSSYASATSEPDRATTTSSSEMSSGSGAKNGKNGYKLSFYFRPSQYFTDEVLEKTYYYKDSVDDFGELLYDKAVGCQIHWKPGKDLTLPKDDDGDDDDDDDDDGPSESFFTFFKSKQMPSDSEIDKLRDAAYNELLDEVEGDSGCGEDIRDEVIPYALTYLLDPPPSDEEYDSSDEEDSEGEDPGDSEGDDGDDNDDSR